jgi:hypothetical protein
MRIRLGDQGEEVRDIQSRLLRLKYDLGMSQADGIYGELTEEAVKNFQAQVGLNPSGVVDDLTWQKLFEESLFLGERLLYLHFPYFKGSDVRELQQKLVNLGFNPGPVDGIFGPKTERALREFQQSVGVIVDGILGPETLAFLERFKKREKNQKEVPDYPYREIVSPFPPDLRIALFVNLPETVVDFLKSYLASLSERLLRVFNAWGIPCFSVSNLSCQFETGDLLLVFEGSQLRDESLKERLTIKYLPGGLKAGGSQKIADFIFKKTRQRFPKLSENLFLDKGENLFPADVLAVAFYFSLLADKASVFSVSEEFQQRLAGAVAEGIKEYFHQQNKKS